MRVTAVLALTLFATAAHAQSGYPNRPIKMIVPLAAASAVDVGARLLAQKMSQNMGQQIVIENQPARRGRSARASWRTRPPTATRSAASTTAS